MVSFDYAFYHIERVLRMVRGDENALNEMDISGDGFWRSFAAFFFALPAFYFSWVMDARDWAASGLPFSMSYVVFVNAIVEISLWVLPVLLLALVLKPLNLTDRFSHLIIARNWISVPLAYFFTLFELPSLFITGFELSRLVYWFAFSALLVILARLTRFSLQSEPAVAWALVIGEMIIVIGFMMFVYSLLGFYDALPSS